MIHLIGVEHKVQCKNPQWSVTQTHRDDWDRYSSIIERYLCENSAFGSCGGVF
jgi:hypothetical protein